MKKVLLFMMIVAGAALSASAQSGKSKFSIGLDAGLATSSQYYESSVIGASVKYDYPLASNTFVNLSAGYSSLNTKDGHGTSGFIPVKAGLKYFLNQTHFYGEAQAGAAFSTKSGGGTAFAYAPGIGYTFSRGVDLGLRYEGWTKNGGTIGQVGLRLAYGF